MREFYRETQWWMRGPENRIETENFRVMTIDNWPNRSTFNILNKETNRFVTIEDTTDTSEFVHWAFRLFMEQNDTLYLVITGEEEPKARFYEVDFEGNVLNYSFTVQHENPLAGRWFLNANGLYFYQNGGWNPLPSNATGGWDPATSKDTLTASIHPFYAINFETESFELRSTPVGIFSWGWGNLYWQDYMISEGIITYDDSGRGYFDGLTLTNLELGHRHVFQNTTWDDWASTQHDDELGISGSLRMELYVIDDFLVESTRINDFIQIIKIYDLNAMELIYHGRINIRRDQGLLPDTWRGIRSFEVRIREEPL